MRARELVLVGALLVGGCGKGSNLECGDKSCADGLVCDRATLLCVNNSAPRITLEQPTPNAFTAASEILILGTITDDEGSLATVEASGDDGQSWVPVSVDPDGRFSQTIPLPIRDSEPLVLRVRAADRLGLVGEAEVSIQVDNAGPACEFVSPVPPGAFTAQPSLEHQVVVSVSDGSGLVEDSALSIDGAAPRPPAAIEAGRAIFVWTPPVDANGERVTLTFTAADAHGNTCSISGEFIVDLKVPTIELLAPVADDPRVFSSATVSVSGVADDHGKPPEKVTVQLEGEPTPVIATLRADRTWSAELPLPVQDLRTGKIVARAQDEAGNQATAEVLITFDRIPPRITITAPPQDARLNLAALGSGMTIPVAWTVEDAAPIVVSDLTGVTPQRAISVNGTSAAIETSDLDDPTTYTVTVWASDGANDTEVSRTFQVDRVPPSMSFDRATGQRLTPTSITATISEPVTVHEPVLELSPSAPAPVVSGNSYTVTGLEHDEVYTVTVAAGAMVDAFGNPNEEATVRFHTMPKSVSSGVTLLSGVTSFDAFADQDGVVSIAAITYSAASGHSYVAGWIDPKTGTWTEAGTSGAANPKEVVVTSYRALDNLAAVRNRGWVGTEQPDGASILWWASGAGTVQQLPLASKAVAVTVPPACRDPVGLAQVGRVVPGSYLRAPSLEEQTQLAPTAVWQVRPENFTVVEVHPGGIRLQRRTCGCILSGEQCSWKPVEELTTTSLPAVSHFSGTELQPYALQLVPEATGARIYAHNNYFSPRSQTCRAACLSGVSSCPAPVYTNISSGVTYYAPKHIGQTVLVANVIPAPLNGSGTLTFYELDLTTPAGCTTPLATQTLTVPFLKHPARPAMFGRTPGVLYLDGVDLKVWIP
jgi:hypothetical protein